MADSSHLTTGELAALFGLADWQIRRAVDALPDDVPRAGLYRLLSRDLLPKLVEEMKARGWLQAGEEVSADG